MTRELRRGLTAAVVMFPVGLWMLAEGEWPLGLMPVTWSVGIVLSILALRLERSSRGQRRVEAVRLLGLALALVGCAGVPTGYILGEFDPSDYRGGWGGVVILTFGVAFIGWKLIDALVMFVKLPRTP